MSEKTLSMDRELAVRLGVFDRRSPILLPRLSIIALVSIGLLLRHTALFSFSSVGTTSVTVEDLPTSFCISYKLTCPPVNPSSSSPTTTHNNNPCMQSDVSMPVVALITNLAQSLSVFTTLISTPEIPCRSLASVLPMTYASIGFVFMAIGMHHLVEAFCSSLRTTAKTGTADSTSSAGPRPWIPAGPSKRVTQVAAIAIFTTLPIVVISSLPGSLSPALLAAGAEWMFMGLTLKASISGRIGPWVNLIFSSASLALLTALDPRESLHALTVVGLVALWAPHGKKRGPVLKHLALAILSSSIILGSPHLTSLPSTPSTTALASLWKRSWSESVMTNALIGAKASGITGLSGYGPAWIAAPLGALDAVNKRDMPRIALAMYTAVGLLAGWGWRPVSGVVILAASTLASIWQLHMNRTWPPTLSEVGGNRTKIPPTLRHASSGNTSTFVLFVLVAVVFGGAFALSWNLVMTPEVNAPSLRHPVVVYAPGSSPYWAGWADDYRETAAWISSNVPENALVGFTPRTKPTVRDLASRSGMDVSYYLTTPPKTARNTLASRHNISWIVLLCGDSAGIPGSDPTTHIFDEGAGLEPPPGYDPHHPHILPSTTFHSQVSKLMGSMVRPPGPSLAKVLNKPAGEHPTALCLCSAAALFQNARVTAGSMVLGQDLTDFPSVLDSVHDSSAYFQLEYSSEHEMLHVFSLRTDIPGASS